VSSAPHRQWVLLVLATATGQEVTFKRFSPGSGGGVATTRRTWIGEPMKKIKTPKKTKLKIERDILRMLQVNELRDVAGGTDYPDQVTAASGAQVCCA
jgi:hypothetical protein